MRVCSLSWKENNHFILLKSELDMHSVNDLVLCFGHAHVVCILMDLVVFMDDMA